MSRLERILAALAVLPFGLGFSVGESKPGADVVFAFADPAIIESSGLVAQDGRFATVNDSGDGGRVFTVDPADGATVAETTWDGAPADVESMALTPEGDVLVGDTGGNISPWPSYDVPTTVSASACRDDSLPVLRIETSRGRPAAQSVRTRGAPQSALAMTWPSGSNDHDSVVPGYGTSVAVPVVASITQPPPKSCRNSVSSSIHSQVS